jgi:hypothetical protein
MKKLWFGITLFLLCLGTNCFASPDQTAEGPKIVLKEKAFDFKEVMEGEIIEHSFNVFNEGDQPLEIKKVKRG